LGAEKTQRRRQNLMVQKLLAARLKTNGNEEGKEVNLILGFAITW